MSEMITDPLWWEDVDRARKTRPEDKLLAGPDLFDYACGITLSGIRWQHPGISDSAAIQILRDRLKLAERLEARR